MVEVDIISFKSRSIYFSSLCHIFSWLTIFLLFFTNTYFCTNRLAHTLPTFARLLCKIKFAYSKLPPPTTQNWEEIDNLLQNNSTATTKSHENLFFELGDPIPCVTCWSSSRPRLVLGKLDKEESAIRAFSKCNSNTWNTNIYKKHLQTFSTGGKIFWSKFSLDNVRRHGCIKNVYNNVYNRISESNTCWQFIFILKMRIWFWFWFFETYYCIEEST